MPRLVRRKPLLDRVQDFLNPGDFLLWLSEEIETRDWDSKHIAGPVAFGVHVVFLIARANAGSSSARGGDDVFGDDYSGSGWLSYIASFLVYTLSALSILNAAYTFNRTRHYRLFETPIETAQNTPSAHRVRVDSSPVASSPLRFLTNMLGDTAAETRAHPDPTRDVWEIAVWDPLPICLRLFCLFSPAHVLIYWLLLPTQLSDPRPSMTVFTTIVLQLLLSAQSISLQNSFTQQEKDSAIIQKEVMNEYDIKFVHPRLQPLVRDVGTQFYGPSENFDDDVGEVDTYTPNVTLKRGFRTNPNPNYAKHIDPENTEHISRSVLSPTPIYTPSAYNSRDPTPLSNITPRQPIRQPQFRQSISSSVATGGDGGSLGAYSHMNSPLRKATSMHDMQNKPRNSIEMAALEQKERSRSPAKKRLSDAHRAFLGLEPRVSTSAFDKPEQHNDPYKRGPSRY